MFKRPLTTKTSEEIDQEYAAQIKEGQEKYRQNLLDEAEGGEFAPVRFNLDDDPLRYEALQAIEALKEEERQETDPLKKQAINELIGLKEQEIQAADRLSQQAIKSAEDRQRQAILAYAEANMFAYKPPAQVSHCKVANTQTKAQKRVDGEPLTVQTTPPF